jgi:hypothetical protein
VGPLLGGTAAVWLHERLLRPADPA